MITRTLEWHRIVNVKPSSDTIDRRTKSVADLVKVYDESKEWHVILQSASGVVSGFDKGHEQDSVAVKQIVQVLKEHDSTVPQDLTYNALELRAAAATALGEILIANSDKYPSNTALMVATALDSGLNLRPRPKERHLKVMLDELNDVVQRTLSCAQEIKRRRTTSAGAKVLAIDEKTATEPLAAIKSLTTAVKSMAREFANQVALDREELEILWWLFSRESSTSHQAIVEMMPGKAAFTAGIEVANLCLLPPPANAFAFVKRAMEQVKKADAKRSLEKVIEETDSSGWAQLIACDENAQPLSSDYPALFPLSWLCTQLIKRNVTTGWAAEYHVATQLDAAQSIDSATVAGQALKERIAQRLYSSLVGE